MQHADVGKHWNSGDGTAQTAPRYGNISRYVRLYNCWSYSGWWPFAPL